MAQTCPDDQTPLTIASGSQVCPRCGGSLLSHDEMAGLCPAADTALAPESRPDCGAFAKTRLCPSCEAPMAPMRIGRMDAWVERCPSCGVYWVEKQDRRTLQMMARQQLLKATYESFSEEERKEIARDLAEASKGKGYYEISGLHAVLAAIGLPVVSRTEGCKTPFATWAPAAALIVFFAADWISGGELRAELTYNSADPSLFTALTSCFVHFGVLHLVGNLFFLFAFGDAVEQQLSRPTFLGLFLVVGALGAIAQGLVSSSDVLVGGASGGVSGLMGAAFVLQRRARVAIGFHGAVVELPIVVYGVLEFVYQGLMASIGRQGVAWWAHLTGLGLGVVIGLAVLFLRDGEAQAAKS
ncbi:MAG: rhomboid family intramembrane serine protease [Myxococcales bacterium]